MARSAIATADRPESVEFVVWTDEDDRADYDQLLWQMEHVTVLTGPRTVLSMCWNFCWREARGDIFGHLGDDVVFRSQGWDTHVRNGIEHHEDRIAFVHGSDGIQDQRLGTHGFVSKEWTDAVGYFVPPYFASDYNDTWLNEVADMIGRRLYVPAIVTEHMHYSAGKAEKDQNTIERLERHDRERPQLIWGTTRHLREIDANKLREKMQ